MLQVCWLWGLSWAFAQSQPPQLDNAAVPDYPLPLREAGVEGPVELDLSIDAQGRVVDATVVRPLHPDCDAAALRAAHELTFQPATDDGVPVAAELRWVFWFTLGKAGADSVPYFFSARGRVQDADGLDLEDVVVTWSDGEGEPVRTTTNGEGRFSVQFLIPGTWTLTLHKPGFRDARFELELAPGETVTLPTMTLVSETVSEIEVIGIRPTWRDVERGRRDVEPDPITSTYELTRRDIETTPGSLEDIARAVHALPGVVSDGDLLAGFFVRGGEQRDVVYLLDRVPLDNPFHLAGFNSIFNPDLIETVQFHAGAAPADVPSGTSAVMAVQTWDGSPRSKGRGFDGALDLSASSARAMIIGPVDKADKLTIALAARRTYLEGYFQVMKWLDVLDTAFAAPEFSELSARMAWRPHPEHRLMLTALRSGDSIGIVDSEDESLVNVSGAFELRNVLHLASADWTVTPRDGVQWRTTVAYTDEISEQERTLAGTTSQRFRVRRAYARSDLRWSLGPHELEVGADGSLHGLDAEGQLQDNRPVPTWAQVGIGDLGLDQLDIDVDTDWPAASGYVDLSLRGPVRVRAGLRAEHSGLADDTWLSPRAGVSVPLFSGATVPKASWGIYQQPLRDPVRLDPRVGNPDLAPERAHHFVVGIDQMLVLPIPEAGGLVRLEGYSIELQNLVVAPGSAQAVATGGTYDNAGRGRNRGLDALVVLRHPRWGVQATYGLLWSQRTDPGVPSANPVPTPQDQRHTFGLAGEWQPLTHWRFTARYSGHTGRPVSSVAAASEDTLRLVGLNDERLGPTHQIDARAEWRRSHRGYRLTFYAEILNIGNIQSDFLPIHDVQKGELNTTMLRHLPMRPFLGLRADF